MPAVRLSGIKVVTFDLDDTLYPERQYAFSGFQAVAEWLRARLDCPFDTAARMCELFTTGDRRHVFDSLLLEVGCKEPASLVQEMVACYRAHRPAIALHPDAETAIRQWHSRFGLALLSDGPLEMQRLKVAALNLSAFLDPIVLTDAWGREYWKPHIRGFQTIEGMLDATGAACVYIADNPSKDFVGPRSLGWHTVQVRRPDGLYCNLPEADGGTPDHQVASLADLELLS